MHGAERTDGVINILHPVYVRRRHRLCYILGQVKSDLLLWKGRRRRRHRRERSLGPIAQ